MDRKLFRITHQHPAPGIECSEIVLTNGEQDLSEGYFVTLFELNAFKKPKPVISAVMNPPFFQLSVNVDPQNIPPRAVVLLGDTISDPKNEKMYEIPAEIDLSTIREVRVDWKKGEIISVSINNRRAALYSPI